MARSIGIDGSRATVGAPTGTERYAIELLAAMAALDPPDDLRVYFNAERAPTGTRFPGRAVPMPASRFWTLRTLSREMRRNPPELLFVPSHVIPPIHPRSVVTIHDLGYLSEPDAHEPIHRKQLEWATRWNCHAAAGIVAVSEFTRRDLIERLHVAPEKIRTIHHGVSSSFRRSSPNDIAHIRRTYRLPDRFILAVGTIHPRKNLVRLIQAFEQIAAGNSEVGLVLCGNLGWRSDDVLDRARRSPFSRRIRHVGFVPEVDLPALYSAASITAFVSRYEGFGMPALESMACGTPVLAADRSALPEICGGAALLVDPFDIAAIAGGMTALLEDSPLRTIAIDAGIQRADSFTWQNCARETLAFLRAIRDNSR